MNKIIVMMYGNCKRPNKCKKNVLAENEIFRPLRMND